MRDNIKAAALWIARLFRPTQCPECNAYLRHSPDCPLNSKDRRLEHYQYSIGLHEGIMRREQEFRDHCVKVWSGLYFKQRAINKSIIQENNKLRKEQYPGKC